MQYGCGAGSALFRCNCLGGLLDSVCGLFSDRLACVLLVLATQVPVVDEASTLHELSGGVGAVAREEQVIPWLYAPRWTQCALRMSTDMPSVDV